MKRIKRLVSPALTYLAVVGSVFAQGNIPLKDVQVSEQTLGFQIPSFADILTFLIRGFLALAGVAAILYLLWGAFSWVTSGGNKESVEKARDKIIAAVTGVILVVVVIALVATLETVVFQGNLCFGLTCKFTIPALLKAP